MILKLMKEPYPNEVWFYIDQVAKVRNYGQLYMPPDDKGERALAMVRSQTEMNPAVKQLWGPVWEDGQGWADQIWPQFFDDERPRSVTSLALDRRDGTSVLVFCNLSAYLMSDQGDTIEKIRG